MRERRANGLIVAVSLFASLGAAEAVLRRWFPLDTVVLEPDRRYLYKFIPGSRQLNRPLTASGAPTVLVTINKEGRRGPLVDRSIKRRVIVYGDSFIAAEGTPLEQTFVSRLEDHLVGVQVLNGGVPGYGPDQSARVMEDEIDRLRPSVVVFSIYSGNDFGDLVRNKLWMGNAALDERMARSFAYAREQQPVMQVWRRLQAAFRKPQPALDIAALGRGLPDAWLEQSRREFASSGALVHNLFEDGYDIDLATDPESDSARRKVELMRAVMAKVEAVAARQGVPLLFLIVPSPIDAMDRWDVVIDTARFPGYDRARLSATVESIAREQGARSVNLLGPFRTHQAENLYYRGLDDHWNAAGQELGARLVADAVRDWLK